MSYQNIIIIIIIIIILKHQSWFEYSFGSFHSSQGFLLAFYTLYVLKLIKSHFLRLSQLVDARERKT